MALSVTVTPRTFCFCNDDIDFASNLPGENVVKKETCEKSIPLRIEIKTDERETGFQLYKNRESALLPDSANPRQLLFNAK